MVHVERINVRAHVNAWTILAHRHANLAQLFMIAKGGGVIGMDGASLSFSAPCLIWLPANVVHAFEFEPETDGMVLTVTVDALRAAHTRLPEATLDAPILLTSVDDKAWRAVNMHLTSMGDEIVSGDDAAELALFHHLALTVMALARVARNGQLSVAQTAAAGLVARFRALVDTRYREHVGVPVYASALGVTADKLHAVCSKVAGRPPSVIINERIMVEARRALIYTTMSVAEIAYDLGFDDAAYFSRFFTRRAGQSPAALRRAASR